MNLAPILDPQAAAIVIGGTLLASVLRCGVRAAWGALRAAAGLFTKRFNREAVRADLAMQIQAIEQDGILRAELHISGDAAFDAASSALIRQRSLEAFHEEHERFRIRRDQETECAVTLLHSVGELAPVLGLVGTLLALGSLSAGGMVIADYGRAIGTAVTTTIYGLILANFVAHPLCSRVQRRADAEEAERAELLQWMADNVRGLMPLHEQAQPDHFRHLEQRIAEWDEAPSPAPSADVRGAA